MTTSELFRRDPPEGKKEFSTHKGFTLIELMIVIGVIAIITSLALPSYRTLIEKRELTSGAQQASAFLSSAKMEAVKRNEFIAIWRDVGDQCLGFYAYDPDDPRDSCDCTEMDPTAADACSIDEFRAADGTGMVLHVLNDQVLNKPLDITAIDLGGLDDLVVVDPVRGMLVEDDTVGLPLEAKLLSKEQNYALNVRLSATGRVTICNDATAELDVPGFDVCRVIP